MKNTYLRVKIKSLAEEARIIRLEELRAKKKGNYALLNELHWHRTYKVRKAARETLIAYQYLRGVPYSAIEKPGSRPADWSAIFMMVKRYGPAGATLADLHNWLEAVKKAA